MQNKSCYDFSIHFFLNQWQIIFLLEVLWRIIVFIKQTMDDLLFNSKIDLNVCFWFYFRIFIVSLGVLFSSCDRLMLLK